MGCLYNGWDGFCVCDDDPFNSCPSYESDSICFECGADLNVEDYTCDYE